MISLDFPYGFFNTTGEPDLVERLDLGIVEFMYAKKDGSVRIAKGTRNMLLDVIDWDDIPMDITTPPNHVRTYFDLDKKRWRCFIKDNLIWYSTIVEVDDNQWT